MAWWTRRRLSLASVIIALPLLLGTHLKSQVSQLSTPSWFPYAPDNDQGILFRLDDDGHDRDFSLRPMTAKLVASNLTVNLVIASLAEDDISWTEKLRDYLPNLRIIRYVSDSIDADYHPPLPRKGREALIYHTYFYDFYDDLPDISIMAHPHENPWHVEPTLLRSMSFALSRLNLERVLERRYFNLRVSWKDACPVKINMSRPASESTSKEDSYMRHAFRHNFDDEVPEIMAGACCSQFAVSRDAIHRNPRSQYRKHMNWLISTKIRDYITGRVWEHMWPWLFLGEAVNCPAERETYCDMYGVCFEDDETPGAINELAQERRTLEEMTEFWIEIFRPHGGVYARRRIPEIDGTIRKEVARAVANGARGTDG